MTKRTQIKKEAIDEIVYRVEKNELKHIRIVFVDQHGVTRGKTIAAGNLRAAFESGISMTSTLLLKDTSHATVFPVWQPDAGFGKGVMTGASDFLMFPDPKTFKILPWLDHTGWMISNIAYQDGRDIEISTRQILANSIERLKSRNMELICGLEVEFYVLQLEDPALEHRHSERPQIQPQTSLISHGYQYLTENNADQLDDVMQLLSENARALGLPLRTMESEFGPSQFEFTFDAMSALECADTMVLFRNMVKQVCNRQGYHATFMCRPKFKNAMGNGWHLHQSLVDSNSRENLMVPSGGEQITGSCSSWIAGILAHARESCVLSTPTVNGYKRYQPFALAPDRIEWGMDNRGAMLRCLASAGNPASRVENRVGEPAANPYLYIASQIITGLAGLENKLQAPVAVEQPYVGDGAKLPGNLGEAIDSFQESQLFRNAFGAEFVDYFCKIKKAEWQRYLASVSQWEHREYFSLF